MAQFKGLDDLFDVLSLIKDPTKFEARLQELKDVVEQYKVVVEAVVKLAEVNEYTSSIKQREQQTQDMLSKAERDVAAIIKNAEHEAGVIRTEALDEKSVFTEKNKTVTSLKSQLDRQLKENITKSNALSQAQLELRQRRAEVEAQALEVSARLEKLKGVMQ